MESYDIFGVSIPTQGEYDDMMKFIRGPQFQDFANKLLEPWCRNEAGHCVDCIGDENRANIHRGRNQAIAEIILEATTDD